MTMNVTTTPVSPTVPGDASTTGQGTPTEVSDQFADALAGFLGEAPTGQGEPSDLVEAPLTPGTETATAAMAALVPLMGLVPAAIASAKVTAVVAALTGTAGSGTPVLGTQPEQSLVLTDGSPEGDSVLVEAGSTPSATQTTTTPIGGPSRAGAGLNTDAATPAVSPETGPGATPDAPVSGLATGSTPNDPRGPQPTAVEAMSALSSLGVSIVAEEGAPSSKNTPITLPETGTATAETAPAAPVTGPTPTTPTATTIPAAPATAPRPVQVAQQVATQVAFLSGAVDGSHTMTLQITPDDLGPVQVQVTVTDGALDMTLLAALEVGRDTLTQAAPELRRYLEAAGLTCNSVEVDLSNEQSSWFTQPDADRDSEAHQPSNRREQAGTPSGDGSDSTQNPADTATRNSTSTGVDLRL